MRLCLITLLVVGLSRPVGATVILPADLGELSRDAQAIARGRVVAVDAQWTEGRRTIETIVTLEAEVYLKGQLGATVQFRVPGGTMGRLRNLVVGAPRFAVGQRVVVFLGVVGPTLPFVLGLNQGVFRVAQTDQGAWMVSPPPLMPGVFSPVSRGSATLVPSPLDAFERQVRTIVEGSR